VRATPFQWLRGALRTVALLGAVVSLLGGCVSFISPRIVMPFATPLGYMGVATLILSSLPSRSIQQTPQIAPLWKRGIYTFVAHAWFAWCVLYLVTAPEPGASVSGLERASPLAFWKLSASSYASTRLAWHCVTALVGFVMSSAALDPPSPGRVDTGEPPRRLALLSKRGI